MYTEVWWGVCVCTCVTKYTDEWLGAYVGVCSHDVFEHFWKKTSAATWLIATPNSACLHPLCSCVSLFNFHKKPQQLPQFELFWEIITFLFLIVQIISSHFKMVHKWFLKWSLSENCICSWKLLVYIVHNKFVNLCCVTAVPDVMDGT